MYQTGMKYRTRSQKIKILKKCITELDQDRFIGWPFDIWLFTLVRFHLDKYFSTLVVHV